MKNKSNKKSSQQRHRGFATRGRIQGLLLGSTREVFFHNNMYLTLWSNDADTYWTHICDTLETRNPYIDANVRRKKWHSLFYEETRTHVIRKQRDVAVHRNKWHSVWFMKMMILYNPNCSWTLSTMPRQILCLVLLSKWRLSICKTLLVVL